MIYKWRLYRIRMDKVEEDMERMFEEVLNEMNPTSIEKEYDIDKEIVFNMEREIRIWMRFIEVETNNVELPITDSQEDEDVKQIREYVPRKPRV